MRSAGALAVVIALAGVLCGCSSSSPSSEFVKITPRYDHDISVLFSGEGVSFPGLVAQCSRAFADADQLEKHLTSYGWPHDAAPVASAFADVVREQSRAFRDCSVAASFGDADQALGSVPDGRAQESALRTALNVPEPQA